MTPKPINGTAQKPMSYDDRQLAAVLVRCSGCGIEYYMTQNHGLNETCVDCRWRWK